MYDLVIDYHSANIYFFHQDSAKTVYFPSLGFCFSHLFWQVGYQGMRCSGSLARHLISCFFPQEPASGRRWFKDERRMKQVWTQPTARSLANLTPASLWAHEWEQMFAVVCHWDFSGFWCNIIVAIAYRNTSASGPNECSTAVFKMQNQQGTPA